MLTTTHEPFECWEFVFYFFVALFSIEKWLREEKINFSLHNEQTFYDISRTHTQKATTKTIRERKSNGHHM